MFDLSNEISSKTMVFWCFLTCCKLLPSAEKIHKILGPKVWWKSQPSARYFGLVNRNTILRPLLQEEGGHDKLSYMSQTGHGLLFFGLNFKGEVSPVISKGRCQGETMTMLDLAANCNPTRSLCFLFRDSLFPDGTLHWTWISHVLGVSIPWVHMSQYGCFLRICWEIVWNHNLYLQSDVVAPQSSCLSCQFIASAQ